jgi:hypothetical protein
MDNFKFAQHLADAAYAYEIEQGMGGVTAANSYSQVFALVMHRDDIERAYGKIMAIWGLAPDGFSVEYAGEAMALLDKPLAQQTFAELRTPHPQQAEIDRESAEELRR